MRARRLRRLGVTAPTVTVATPSSLTDTQIDIKTATRKDISDEKDENQHKQKQPKFDENIQDMSALNNNETESGKNSLTTHISLLSVT